jgi:hypothetical protein
MKQPSPCRVASYKFMLHVRHPTASSGFRVSDNSSEQCKCQSRPGQRSACVKPVAWQPKMDVEAIQNKGLRRSMKIRCSESGLSGKAKRIGATFSLCADQPKIPARATPLAVTARVCSLRDPSMGSGMKCPGDSTRTPETTEGGQAVGSKPAAFVFADQRIFCLNHQRSNTMNCATAV